jgi:hypothetical protein
VKCAALSVQLLARSPYLDREHVILSKRTQPKAHKGVPRPIRANSPPQTCCGAGSGQLAFY